MKKLQENNYEFTEEDYRKIDEVAAEYAAKMNAEAERIKPQRNELHKFLLEEFPLYVENEPTFSNAVKIDFGHGYDIFIYIDEKHPGEYSWSIDEQYNNGVDNFFISTNHAKKKYYSIFEILKFLNSVKEWL